MDYISNVWNYKLVDKWTLCEKYAMPLWGEIFDVIGQAKAFNILDLCYHQLSLCEDDKVKTTYWNINQNGKDYLYQMKLPTFWIEEWIDEVSKGDEWGSCKLEIFQMLHW